MPVPIEQLLARLQQVRRCRDNTWMACCPAHDDARPSLQVRLLDNHIMLHCFSGCRFPDIVAALGYQQRDMFPEGSGANAGAVRRPQPSAVTAGSDDAPSGEAWPTWQEAAAGIMRRWSWPQHQWEYHTGAGRLVGVVLRWNLPKGEKMIRPVALHADGWRLGGMPQPRPLYRLPHLLSDPGPVVVAEGEKAADALVACGFNATTSAHGSLSADKSDWRVLAGKAVVLMPDNDGPGRRYVASVARLLTGYMALPLTVVRLPVEHGGDAHDFLESMGGDVDGCRSEIWRLICRAGAKWVQSPTKSHTKRATLAVSQSG